MSDNVRVCPVCDKELSGKQKFCSDAHRKQFARVTHKGDPITPPQQGDPTKVPNKGGPVTGTSSNMTETDKLFEASGYYIFDGELETRSCFACDRKFSTRLKLLKTCSPACQQRVLRAVATNT